MSVAPSPSGAKGEVKLQPSYFTSSLYVNPFREDVFYLVNAFREQFLVSLPTQPFALFKSIWINQGWSWIHLRVFDARAREAFLNVSARLLLETTLATETPISRVAGLFGVYIFFSTQPESSAPPVYAIKHVPISIDHYNSLMELPGVLATTELQPLRTHVSYVLSRLVQANVFHILPTSKLQPENPRTLPREIFCPAERDPSAGPADPATEIPKKKGRPSRREKMQKGKDALKTMDKWLDTTNYVGPSTSTLTPHLSNYPATTRQQYQKQKSELLENLASETAFDGQQILKRANLAMVARLRKIDQIAAERGLEVGGEGGERTGLERVERAAGELDEGRLRGGILNLLEGGGLLE